MTTDHTVESAVAELRSFRSHDPCAAIALSTIKATIHTLERYWLGRGPRPSSARS